MPISIPPFTDVPAPNDPVKSAWAQHITQYAVDTVTIGPTAPTNPESELWYDTADTGTPSLSNVARGYVTHVFGGTGDQSTTSAAFVTVAGTSCSFTASPTRRYKTTINVNISLSANAVAAVGIADGFNNVGVHKIWTPGAPAASNEITLVYIETGLSGTVTRGIAVSTNAGTLTYLGQYGRNSLTLVEDIGGT